MKRILKALALMIFPLLSFEIPPSQKVMASGTQTMLHTDGSQIKDANGNAITFRGTNFGGWLMQEGWMGPVGYGELDHQQYTKITPSSTYGDLSASNAIDTKVVDGHTVNDLSTYWQSGVAQTADGSELLVELDEARYVEKIVVETGPDHVGDYLRGGTVWLSQDWTNWFSPSSLKIDDSRSNEGIVVLDMGPQLAKYIAIRPSQASENGEWWTVANVSLCMGDEYHVRTTLFRRFGEDATNQLFATYQNAWIQASDIAKIASMNMNFVRVPVYWMDFMHPDGTFRTDSNNGFAKLDWVIQQCAQYGIYVLIDFHGAPGGDNCWASCGEASPVPTKLYAGDDATVAWNQNAVLNIWSALATRYKDNPTVGAYGLLNEPVLNFDTNAAYEDLKYGFYDRIYQTVRAIDTNHIVIFEEFMDWSVATNRPERATWTNYMFEKHPYDMDHPKDWSSQKQLANNTVSTMSQIQTQWNVPLLVGEFCLYYFSDVWDDFLSDLNRNGISWTNWAYKVRGTIYDSGGGNWGYYNTFDGEEPDLLHDSYSRIQSLWGACQTSHFQENAALVRLVSARADGSTNHPYVALDRSGWKLSASNTASLPYIYPLSFLKDGIVSTRWSSGVAQAAGQWLMVDFGQNENFDKIEMLGYQEDYPGSYEVSSSFDGVNFSTIELNNVGIGFGTKMVLLPSTPQTARYVKITLKGPHETNNWWSICELNILWRNVNA